MNVTLLATCSLLLPRETTGTTFVSLVAVTRGFKNDADLSGCYINVRARTNRSLEPDHFNGLDHKAGRIESDQAVHRLPFKPRLVSGTTCFKVNESLNWFEARIARENRIAEFSYTFHYWRDLNAFINKLFFVFIGCELKAGKEVAFNPEDDDDDYDHQLSVRMVRGLFKLSSNFY